MRLFIRFEKEQTDSQIAIDTTIVIDDSRNNPDEVVSVEQRTNLTGSTLAPKHVIQEAINVLISYIQPTAE